MEINVFLKKRKLFKPGASFPFLVFGLNQEMLRHHRDLVLDHGEAEDKEDDVSGPHRASDRFIIFPIFQAFFSSSWRKFCVYRISKYSRSMFY